jgi:hypothetical protein
MMPTGTEEFQLDPHHLVNATHGIINDISN